MYNFLRNYGLVAAVCCGASPAFAADMDPVFADDANMLKPIELGTGWYLRGDIGYNIDGAQFRDLNFDVIEDRTEQGDFGERLSYGVGAGLQITPNIRVDITGDRLSHYNTEFRAYRGIAGVRQTPVTNVTTTTTLLPGSTITSTVIGAGGLPITSTSTSPDVIQESTSISEVDREVIFDRYGQVLSSNCVNLSTATVVSADQNCPSVGSTVVPINGTTNTVNDFSLWSVLANAYYDAPNPTPFTPYVGAGGGLTRAVLDYSQTVTCDPTDTEDCRMPNGAGDPNDSNIVTLAGTSAKWLPTLALSAGVAYDITPKVKFDLGYKYTHIFGTDELFADAGFEADDSIQVHSVRAGVRVSTW
ncbi:MAG: hypothetical protein AAGI92_01145 [Pseudomonadota bacterium]